MFHCAVRRGFSFACKRMNCGTSPFFSKHHETSHMTFAESRRPRNRVIRHKDKAIDCGHMVFLARIFGHFSTAVHRTLAASYMRHEAAHSFLTPNFHGTRWMHAYECELTSTKSTSCMLSFSPGLYANSLKITKAQNTNLPPLTSALRPEIALMQR